MSKDHGCVLLMVLGKKYERGVERSARSRLAFI
jgi:hypothetical protein